MNDARTLFISEYLIKLEKMVKPQTARQGINPTGKARKALPVNSPAEDPGEKIGGGLPWWADCSQVRILATPSRLGENMKPEEKEGEIIDVKKFGKWLIISYRGKFGILFTKIRIEEKNENRN